MVVLEIVHMVLKNERVCKDIKTAQEQDWDGTIGTN